MIVLPSGVIPGTLRAADPVAMISSRVAVSVCLLPSWQRHFDTLPAGEPRRALDPIDLVLAEQHLDAAGQPGHDLVLARVHGGHVEPHARPRSHAGQPPFLGRLRDLERVRVLEERLGGNASPDQARAAERLLLFDDRHLQAELRARGSPRHSRPCRPQLRRRRTRLPTCLPCQPLTSSFRWNVSSTSRLSTPWNRRWRRRA